VILATRNVFLGGMGALAIYFSLMGWRLAQHRFPNHRPTRFDRLLPQLGMVAFGLFFLFGVRALLARNVLGLVPLLLGGFSATAALGHHRHLARPPANPRAWLPLHVGAISIAFIASLTAFNAATMTNWFPDFPEWILWLWPAAVFTPVVRRLERRASAEPRPAGG